MKTLTIVLTDGPYISEYAEIAYKLAETALKHYKVNIFMYLDGVHIPKRRAKSSFLYQCRPTFLGTCGKRGCN